MIENEQFLGHCPKGQLEDRHIEVWNISAGQVVEYGIVVGILKTNEYIILTADGTKNMTPIGITHSTFIVADGGTRSVNVMRFRNKQAIAVKTSDATVTYGSPVFVDSHGMATQTVTSGWKIGYCASTAVQTNGVGFIDSGLSYILVEMQDVEFIGGV